MDDLDYSGVDVTVDDAADGVDVEAVESWTPLLPSSWTRGMSTRWRPWRLEHDHSVGGADCDEDEVDVCLRLVDDDGRRC